MAYSPFIKAKLLVLSFCIIFPVFFTETLVIVEIEHSCCSVVDEVEETQNCIPCERIAATLNLLRNLRETVNFSSSSMFILSLSNLPEKYSDLNLYCLTPVELKVRFNT